MTKTLTMGSDSLIFLSSFPANNVAILCSSCMKTVPKRDTWSVFFSRCKLSIAAKNNVLTPTIFMFGGNVFLVYRILTRTVLIMSVHTVF